MVVATVAFIYPFPSPPTPTRALLFQNVKIYGSLEELTKPVVTFRTSAGPDGGGKLDGSTLSYEYLGLAVCGNLACILRRCIGGSAFCLQRDMQLAGGGLEYQMS